MAGRVDNQAFVSLATNNGYALGALVLGHSLRSVNTNRQLALMITQEVHPQVRQELLGIWDRLIVVDVLDSEDSANLALLQRPDLGITFTKLHAWKLVEYEKCVFLDADTLVLQNVDDLFNRPEISASPDIGWPDCFNSGVFVFVPSLQTHNALIDHALEVGSFDGGDQGLLNSYFNNWLHLGPEHRLPFVYNLHSNSIYTYSPAFKRFGGDVKIVHFIGRKKPWQYRVNLETGKVIYDHGIVSVTSSERFIQTWWDVYNEIAAHRITDIGQESFHPTLHVGSDSEDSEYSETESGSIHDVEAITSSFIAPVIIAPLQISPNHSEHHSFITNPQSTSIPSQSHEMSQITSGVGSIQFRAVTEDSRDQAMRLCEDSSGRWRWEYGQVDYGGVDSFENIQRKLDETLSNGE